MFVNAFGTPGVDCAAHAPGCLCNYQFVLRTPRAAGARNIYVGFADVTRASGVNPAHCSALLSMPLLYTVVHFNKSSQYVK
jgi:hypothetical protein